MRDQGIAYVDPPPPGPRVPKKGPQYVSARIQSSLEGALVSASDPVIGPQLAQVAKRVMMWWLDVNRDLRVDDRVELVYLEKPAEEPEILAIWVVSQKLGRRFAAVHFKAPGAPYARWVDPSGLEVAPSLVHPPIQSYAQITAVLGDNRRHRGVDFKAPVGTPILATFDGVVRRRNWSTRRNGRCLHIVNTQNTERAFYLHLDRVDVRPGQSIKQGQVLGRSGNTGRSTAPHLHYQLETQQGRLLDPLKAHATTRHRLDKPGMNALKRLFRQYEEMRKNPA